MKKLPYFLLATLLAIASVGVTAAQTTTGTVDGIVKDESGAVIPGAEITITNVNTNARRTAISNDEGRFNISSVPAGEYRAECKLTGFKTATARFKLDVAGRQTLNFVLQIGDISETVEVTGAVQKVNTEEGTLSSVVSGEQVQDLPLNGRNVFQLALLQPNVTAGINDGIGGQSSINASGNRVRGNNFSLDGVSNNDPITGGSTSVTPNLDAVQEFRIQNNNFSAEFGRNNGAVVNVITKSGTNEFHGTAFWFHRNDALDAREVFDGEDPALLRRHQAGFTIGGPVVRDRTFWFFSFEAFRDFSGESSQARFETPELRQQVINNFPNSLAAQLFQQFPGPPLDPGTSVDVGSFSGQFQNPGAPDGVPDTGVASFFVPDLFKSYEYNVRVDHDVTDNNKLFFRYIWQDNESPSANIRSPELGNPFDGHSANGVISDTHIFSPTVVNEIRYGYNRTRTDFPVSRFDITDFNIFTNVGSDGIFGFGAYGGTPQFFTAEEYHLVDVVSLNFGDHGIKTGFEYRWNQDDSDFQFLTRGYVTFDGLFDFVAGLPNVVGARIDPRVIGEPKLVGTPHNFRQSEWALFIQDDWKVTDRLTFNLGLRYDNYGQVTELEDRLANIIFGPGNTATERLVDATVGQVDPDGVFKKDNNNFAPRFGFAYDLFGDGKTSLRGGYGVAYDRLFLNVTGNIRFNPPFSSNLFLIPEGLASAAISAQQWAEFLSPAASIPFGLPAGVGGLGFNEAGGPLLGVTFPGAETIPLGGRISLRSPDPNLKTSYSQNWFFGIQRELPNDMIFEVNYTGNVGRKLGFIDQLNRFSGSRFGFPHPITGQPAVRINDFFTSENLRTNNVNSAHHGGSVSIQKRFSQGLAFQSAWTFGKTIDFGSDNFSSNAGSIFSVDPRNRDLEKGLASFDIRNRWVSNFIYEIPFMKDQQGFVGQALGGWQIQSIITFQAGSPFTPQAFSFRHDYNGDFRNNDRPDAPAGGTDQFNDNSVQDYIRGIFGATNQRANFNPDGPPCNRGSGGSDIFSGACAAPGLGTLGRSNFIGPGFKNVDFSIFKDFRVPWFQGEDATVQFRAEFFNITNRVNLGQPSRSFTSSFFGKSFSAFDAREIQFALKFIF